MLEESAYGHEAALVILAPDVDALVGRFRDLHDPSAALGVPAHITINYPFVPAMSGDASPDQELKSLFARVPPFAFSFRQIARLPHLLYLPPEPAAPFRELIKLVADCFPESPPYGGLHLEVIPHLTVADTEDESVLAAVEAELAPMCTPLFPIPCRADEVWLIDNTSGSWQHRSKFPLGVD
jgi:hypothetical protein